MPRTSIRITGAALILAVAGCAAPTPPPPPVVQALGDASLSTGDDLAERHYVYLSAAVSSLNGLPARIVLSYHSDSSDITCKKVDASLPDAQSGQDPNWVAESNDFLTEAKATMVCAQKSERGGSFVFDPRLVPAGTTDVWVFSDGMVFDPTVTFNRPLLTDETWQEQTIEGLASAGALDGVTVTWFGLGDKAGLDRDQAVALQNVWTAVVERSGGTFKLGVEPTA
jgi:hypothetical protein